MKFTKIVATIGPETCTAKVKKFIQGWNGYS